MHGHAFGLNVRGQVNCHIKHQTSASEAPVSAVEISLCSRFSLLGQIFVFVVLEFLSSHPVATRFQTLALKFQSVQPQSSSAICSFCSCSLSGRWRREWRQVIAWRLQKTAPLLFTPWWGPAGSRTHARDPPSTNWERNWSRRSVDWLQAWRRRSHKWLNPDRVFAWTS